ncbi:MAG TPA: class I SAM-dependent methyltransferase [Micropepsaceae bacterium]|nr:class I SAM-dependent methyltransferase [Micropepsaceae bacterium]
MADLADPSLIASPFDASAAAYDESFTDSFCGRALRETVWLRIAPHLRAGMDVLDLGCGTGEDAIRLARLGCNVVAADSSAAMLKAAAAKLAGASARIRLAELDFNRTDSGIATLGPFDFVLSNFGAANCIEDLAAFGRALARCVKPGGKAAIVFMGRFCALETLYYSSRFDRRAGRRWSGKAEARLHDRSFAIRYWKVGEVKRATPAFRALEACGIGVLLPPSHLFHLERQRPRLFAALARWDRKVANLWPLSRMGDHTLLVLERRADVVERRQ